MHEGSVKFMKKRRYLLIGMSAALLMTTFSVTGCAQETGENVSGEAGTEEAAPKDETEVKDGETEAEAQSESGGDTQNSDGDQSSSGEEAETWNVRVYYVDDQTAEVTGKNVDVRDEYDIWTALQETGIITEDCELLSLTLNEDDKTMDLDFNTATGDRIRSMGTTGETEIIGCIVNTYLEAYSYSGIRLTEEGQPLQTSHGANYDGYTGIISF